MGATHTQHFRHLQDIHAKALLASGHDALILAAGEPRLYFLDDRVAPFQASPHFRYWLPLNGCPGSLLLIRPPDTPTLFFLQPADYWHLPPKKPEGAWTRQVEVRIFARVEKLRAALLDVLGVTAKTAWIGAPETLPGGLQADLNPPDLLAWLHYERAWKTPYELDCMQQAQHLAVRGHRAAEEAWRAGASEFETHLAYVAAVGQQDAELPYGNIIAQNEHAATLHYQHPERIRIPDKDRRSFLIDAGAEAHGYAADITRTYAYSEQDDFASLVQQMDQMQRELIETIKPGRSFVDLHMDTHWRIASVLESAGVVRMAPERQLETGVTRYFFPHGLGHLLGLQVHDIGGWQQDHAGTTGPPPEGHESLRLTRLVEAGQVFTIEPGLYFIPMLLDELRQRPEAEAVDWRCIEQLSSAGGIRIEDNVQVREDGCANLTRDAFRDLES